MDRLRQCIMRGFFGEDPPCDTRPTDGPDENLGAPRGRTETPPKKPRARSCNNLKQHEIRLLATTSVPTRAERTCGDYPDTELRHTHQEIARRKKPSFKKPPRGKPRLKIEPLCGNLEFAHHNFQRPVDVGSINCEICFTKEVLLQCKSCTTSVCPQCYRTHVIPYI